MCHQWLNAFKWIVSSILMLSPTNALRRWFDWANMCRIMIWLCCIAYHALPVQASSHDLPMWHNLMSWCECSHGLMDSYVWFDGLVSLSFDFDFILLSSWLGSNAIMIRVHWLVCCPHVWSYLIACSARLGSDLTNTSMGAVCNRQGVKLLTGLLV